MITLWVRFGIMANSVKAFDSQFSTASSLVNHSLSPARQVEYQEPIDVAKLSSTPPSRKITRVWS